MFKRILALALTILFICFKCLTWVPSAAATGIPAFDAFYYAILQTLGMAYTNGVEMDLAPVIAEVRENVPDYLNQPDTALKYLLREYAGKVWDQLIIQWNDSGYEDATSAEMAAIRIATSEVSTPTLADIVSQYQKKALDNDYEIVTPINTSSVAFWNKYNSLYINDYLDKINSTDTEQPTPDVPLTYEEYIYNINTPNDGLGFFWGDYPVNASGGNIKALPNSLKDVSFVKSTLYLGVDSVINYPIVSQPYTTGDNNLFMSTPIVLNLNHVGNGSYNLFCNTINTDIAYNRTPNDAYYWIYGAGSGTLFNSQAYMISSYTYSNTYKISTQNITFNSLSQALNYCQSGFRNVKIIVDGEVWSDPFNNITINFQSSVPNAVIDNSTDDGKIVSNPIYWVVDNNTGTPIDSQINLDKLIDYLKGVIDGSNSDTSVDFGDLVDAGVIEKQDGTAISDTDVIAVPVADAIDDAFADSDVIDTPITAIEDLPPLPPLPPFFPTPDFPEGDPTSGFHGMSVLARIINITNQSLPSEVILVFYGVVFGAVILGLVKILHK